MQKAPVFPFGVGDFARQTAELDAWRERADRHYPVSRRWTGALRRDLEAEAVAASTSMEGVPVTVDDVRRILAGDRPPSVDESDQALVRGYREAMTFVQRRADDPNFQWSRELVVALQDRVLAADHGAGAGRLRQSGVAIADRRTAKVIFEPPSADEVPTAVDAICAWLNQSSLHPALNSAWCHVAIAAVHPFKDGNGRTARVLASLAMYRGGFRSPIFTSLEEWWGHHPNDYYAAFECLGRTYDAQANVAGFVAAHIEAQLRQVRAFDLREKTTRGLWAAIENLLDDVALPNRLALAVWDAFFGFTVASGSYRGGADVSPATASADLRAATVAGLISARGAGRSRKYVATAQTFDRIAAELGMTQLDAEPEDYRAAILADLTERTMRDEPLSESS